MTIGFALCGSFCTYRQVFPAMEALAGNHTVVPIFSFAAGSIDSRFGKASEHLQKAREICGQEPILTIARLSPSAQRKCWML